VKFQEMLCLRCDSFPDECKGRDYEGHKNRQKIRGFMTTINPYYC
jgi:hypothetical protein